MEWGGEKGFVRQVFSPSLQAQPKVGSDLGVCQSGWLVPQPCPEVSPNTQCLSTHCP